MHHMQTPKCFYFLAYFALGLLFIYGIAGMVLNGSELSSEKPHGEWPVNQHPAKAVLMLLQSIYFLTLLVGSFATYRRSRLLYFLTALILLGAFTIFSIFGLVCIRFAHHIDKPKIYDIFSNTNATKDDFDWLHQFQTETKCCGINNPQNYYEFNEPSANVGYKLPPDSVPKSCCKKPIKNDCGRGILAQNEGVIKQRIHIKGCGAEMAQSSRDKLIYQGGEMLIAALVTLSISIFIYCGATEMFCLSGSGKPHHSESATNVMLSIHDDDEAMDDMSAGRRSDSSQPGSAWKDGAITEGAEPNSNTKDFKPKGRRNSRTREVTMDAQGNLKVQHKVKGVKMDQNHNPEGVFTEFLNERKRSKVSSKKKIRLGDLKLKNLKSSSNKGHQKVIPGKFGGKKLKLGNGSKALLVNGLKTDLDKIKMRNESPSKSTRSDDLLLQKLEMLYEGVDKNTSTLSTTPNPSGSIFFPWQNTQNNTTTTPIKAKKLSAPANQGLSHYSSVPQFHLVSFKHPQYGALVQTCVPVTSATPYTFSFNRNPQEFQYQYHKRHSQSQSHRHTFTNLVKSLPNNNQGQCQNSHVTFATKADTEQPPLPLTPIPAQAEVEVAQVIHVDIDLEDLTKLAQLNSATEDFVDMSKDVAVENVELLTPTKSLGNLDKNTNPVSDSSLGFDSVENVDVETCDDQVGVELGAGIGACRHISGLKSKPKESKPRCSVSSTLSTIQECPESPEESKSLEFEPLKKIGDEEADKDIGLGDSPGGSEVISAPQPQANVFGGGGGYLSINDLSPVNN